MTIGSLRDSLASLTNNSRMRSVTAPTTMHSVEDSFSKSKTNNTRKRVIQYDHYNRYHDNLTFEPRDSIYASDPPHSSYRRQFASPGPSAPSRRRSPPFMPSYEHKAQAAASNAATPPPLTTDPAFDILDWHPAYQSCQRFFLDHAQHEAATQALCALINIRLPFQYFNNPIDSSTSAAHAFNFSRPGGGGAGSPPNRSRAPNDHGPYAFVSLIPYVKRLVVTGFDKPAILHGMFGDEYLRGILPHLDCERRNYLFAAKHEGWGCKRQYDSGTGMGGDESVPFMKPLEEAKTTELTDAERAWSGWLAMKDWMVGPRAPNEERQEQPRERALRINHADDMPDGVPGHFEETEPKSNGHNEAGEVLSAAASTAATEQE